MKIPYNWLKDYAEINIKPSTLYGYKSCLNAHILPRFKDYKLSDITVYELEKFYNDLRKTKSLNPDSNGNHNLLSEAVVRHQHSLLCVMLNTAVKWDFINFNPCLKLTKPPTVTRKEMKFYDEEELKKLPVPVKENFVFKGWYTVNNDLVSNGDKLDSQNITLYAKWKKK